MPQIIHTYLSFVTVFGISTPDQYPPVVSMCPGAAAKVVSGQQVEIQFEEPVFEGGAIKQGNYAPGRGQNQQKMLHYSPTSVSGHFHPV